MSYISAFNKASSVNVVEVQDLIKKPNRQGRKVTWVCHWILCNSSLNVELIRAIEFNLCFYDGRIASCLSLVYEITHIAMLSMQGGQHWLKNFRQVYETWAFARFSWPNSSLINLMNATNLTKQIVLFSFGPNVSQDLGYNTEANTTSGLLASAFFVIGTADYKYYQKKKSYSPYVTCIATPPSSKPPALFEQKCRIF